MHILILLLGVIGVSFSAIFVRFSTAPPLILVFYRMFFSSLLLLPCIVKKRPELLGLTKKDWILSGISGIFLGLHFACYFESLNYTSISSAVVLVDTEVFFVALGSFFLWREKISKNGWIGIFITFVGSIIVAYGDISYGKDIFIGDLIALFGAFCMAVYTIIGTLIRRKTSTIVYTTLVYTSSAITVFIAATFYHLSLFSWGMKNLSLGLCLAVICTLMGHSIFSWALKYLNASFVSTAKLLEPVFASVLGLLIFKEIPQVNTIIGGLIIIIGIWYYSKVSQNSHQ
ncbi:MAG: DMT family transporter [Clostridiales bacterium]|nr:DMT family transporter [Clostridiales bacterium]